MYIGDIIYAYHTDTPNIKSCVILNHAILFIYVLSNNAIPVIIGTYAYIEICVNPILPIQTPPTTAGQGSSNPGIPLSVVLKRHVRNNISRHVRVILEWWEH